MARQLDAQAESQLVDGEPQHWLDQLRMASFRGVPFQVDTIDWTAGDNVVLREYPFQDLPTVFRMGRAAEEIKLSAYVIGADYHLQRAALSDALTGEGLLMHPTAGAMRVFVAGKHTMKEAPTAEGGMARFDITFVRADARRYPQGAVSTQGNAAAKAATARQGAADAFAARWSIAGKPGWVADRAVARLRASLDVLWAPLANAARGLGQFNSDLIASYQTLRDGLADLVATPRQLADQVATLFELPGELSDAAARDLRDAFAWVFDISARVRAVDFEQSIMPAVGAGLVMFGTGSLDAVTTDSAARTALAELLAANDRLFEGLATASYVEAVASVELANHDDALAMRGLINDQVLRLLQADSEAPAAATLPASNWHDAMLALQSAGLADLQARSQNLVRLTSYTPQAWQPVVYISYRLYGTAAYADEIMALNPHITHPLLVPPGRPLRVAAHD